MSSIGTPITQTIPAVGATGTQYATDIDAFLTEVKSRLEAKVPFSSILGSGGALDANNQGIGNVNYLALYPQAAAPTALSTALLSISTYNGDLYWVTTSGVLQLTIGPALNAAGIGGIGGDYGGGNPARENFVDATSTYEFYDDFAGVIWAKTKALQSVLVSAAAPTFSAAMRFAGPASVTYTLPPAAPAANAVLGMDAAGNITTTAAIAQDIVLSGATKIQHGTRKICFGAASALVSVGGTVSALSAITTIASSNIDVPLDGLREKWRLTGATVRHFKTTTGVTTVRIVRTDDGLTTVVGTATSSSAGTQSTAISFTETIDFTGFPISYFLEVSTPATTGDKFYQVILNYDQQ